MDKNLEIISYPAEDFLINYLGDDNSSKYKDRTLFGNMNESSNQMKENPHPFSKNNTSTGGNIRDIPVFNGVLSFRTDSYKMSPAESIPPFSSDTHINIRLGNTAGECSSVNSASYFTQLSSSSSKDVEIIDVLPSSCVIRKTNENLFYRLIEVPQFVASTTTSKEPGSHNTALSPFPFTQKQFTSGMVSIKDKSNNEKRSFTVIKVENSKDDFRKDSPSSSSSSSPSKNSVQPSVRGRKPSKQEQEQNTNQRRHYDFPILRTGCDNASNYVVVSRRGHKVLSSSSMENINRRMKSTLNERNRRRQLKDFLQQLRIEVPGVRDDVTATEASIFMSAANYIRGLDSSVLSKEDENVHDFVDICGTGSDSERTLPASPLEDMENKENENNFVHVCDRGSDSERTLPTSTLENVEVTDRRMKAVLSERKRRRELKDLLGQLRILVPGVRDIPKSSKLSILRSAVDYIRLLKKQKNTYDQTRCYTTCEKESLTDTVKGVDGVTSWSHTERNQV